MLVIIVERSSHRNPHQKDTEEYTPAKGHTCVIFVHSISTQDPQPKYTNYTSTKQARVGWTKLGLSVQPKLRIQEYRNTGMQEYRNAGIQVGIQAVIQEYRNAGIQVGIKVGI